MALNKQIMRFILVQYCELTFLFGKFIMITQSQHVNDHVPLYQTLKNNIHVYLYMCANYLLF